MRQFDGVDGAGFLAHAAVDAAEFVDVEFLGVFLAIGPGGLGGFDVDAAGGAGGGAHEAGDAFDAAFLVLVQAMHAAIGAEEHAALFDGQILTAFLGVLDHEVLAAQHGQHVLHGGAEADEGLGHVEQVAQGEAGFLEDKNV